MSGGRGGRRRFGSMARSRAISGSRSSVGVTILATCCRARSNFPSSSRSRAPPIARRSGCSPPRGWWRAGRRRGRGSAKGGAGICSIPTCSPGCSRPSRARISSATLFELRMIVEPPAAELAARRRDGRDLARMGHALEEMARHGLASEAGRAADQDFHDAVLAATRNAALVSLSSSISAAVGWTTIFKQRKRACRAIRCPSIGRSTRRSRRAIRRARMRR